MSDRLIPRDKCMVLIRDLIWGDEWLTRYAWYKASERLDLDQLNSLLVEVAAAKEPTLQGRSARLDALIAERWQ
jgi:hypothetical protein